MIKRERQRKHCTCCYLPHPPPQSHILEHSATASWAKTFLPAARGATLFCFLVLLMTFCRTDVDIMLNVVICQPASQPVSTQQVPVQGSPQGVSAPPTTAKTPLLPACSSHCSFIRRPLTCRQATAKQAGRQSEVHPQHWYNHKGIAKEKLIGYKRVRCRDDSIDGNFNSDCATLLCCFIYTLCLNLIKMCFSADS